jgi:hypothetical protein
MCSLVLTLLFHFKREAAVLNTARIKLRSWIEQVRATALLIHNRSSTPYMSWHGSTVAGPINSAR